MGTKTEIAWTDSTWTPIRARRKDNGKVGPHCERVSPGCVNCYSEANNGRCLPHNGTGLPFNRQARDLVEIFLDQKILEQPFHWRAPRKIFVCSQTDLFGDWVEESLIFAVLDVLANNPRHTFQALTKRAERMRDVMLRYYQKLSKETLDAETLNDCAGRSTGWQPKTPLENLWLGVSCEDQQRANERIPLLLQTPAAVRFVSGEPLIGAVDLDQDGWLSNIGRCGDEVSRGWSSQRNYIDWVIVGGESGPGARQMDPGWARAIRDQCQAACVPFFFKQWGESAPYPRKTAGGPWFEQMEKVGKKAAGDLLDGRQWRQMPELRAVLPALSGLGVQRVP